jgi:hypothetical protein
MLTDEAAVKTIIEVETCKPLRATVSTIIKRTRFSKARVYRALTPLNLSHLALMLTLIERLSLRQITGRVLHELALSVRAAEAVGLAL